MAVTCDCGETIELIEEDMDFCAVECPACYSDVEYDISNYIGD